MNHSALSKHYLPPPSWNVLFLQMPFELCAVLRPQTIQGCFRHTGLQDGSPKLCVTCVPLWDNRCVVACLSLKALAKCSLFNKAFRGASPQVPKNHVLSYLTLRQNDLDLHKGALGFENRKSELPKPDLPITDFTLSASVVFDVKRLRIIHLTALLWEVCPGTHMTVLGQQGCAVKRRSCGEWTQANENSGGPPCLCAHEFKGTQNSRKRMPSVLFQNIQPAEFSW